MKNIPEISTEHLLNLLSKDGLQLIDVRGVDAYNGWRLENETRGGHIHSARSLPYKWTKYIDWLDIVHAKNLYPQQPTVIYGYEKDEIDVVAEHFTRAGFTNVSAFYHFVDVWSANAQLPMQKLSRYQHLVSAWWLKELIETGRAAEYDNDHYVICHAHYQNRAAYEKGHIPGAIEVDTNWLESEVTWNRRSPQELEKVLCDMGISSDTTVILYGRFDFPDFSDPFPGSSAGHLGAIRCALIMLYAGVKDVRILNGGLDAWLDEGFAESTKDAVPLPVSSFGAPVPAHPEWIVDLPEAKEIIAASDKNLVSVRSWKEFIGDVSGYHYIQKKGRIPGAVFGNCGSDAYHMENYRNLDHTTREYHEIEAVWQEIGVTPDKHNAFYCGTGWRGSEAFLNAWLMGWPRVSVFDGGWFEWSNDEQNPIESGVPAH